MKKSTIIQIILILVLTCALIGLIVFGVNSNSTQNNNTNMGGPNHSQNSEGNMSGASSTSTNKEGVITVSNGSVTYKDGYDSLSSKVSTQDNEITISDIDINNDDYSFTAISSSNSNVTLKNSNISLNVGEEISGTESAGTGVYTDSGTFKITDSNIEVNGAGRYTVAAEQSANMVLNRSSIIAGGDDGANSNTSKVSEPSSNKGLLISGNSRANFSVGASHTFYYNSLCVADGWAALSTDSATGNGLEFVGYNTEAIALHGGYDIYADTNCRDYLYGVKFLSAEVGGIISNNGLISIGSKSDAKSATTKDGNSALKYLEESQSSEDASSVIISGRNNFQLHSPDMMSEGTSDYTAELNIKNSELITDNTINNNGYEYKLYNKLCPGIGKPDSNIVEYAEDVEILVKELIKKLES